MVSFPHHYLAFSPLAKNKNTNSFVDYLIFDDEARISGYMNIMTQKSGLPLFAIQEGNQPIASGIKNTKNGRDIRISDYLRSHSDTALLNMMRVD